MAYPGSTTYPTTPNNLDIVPGQTIVDRDHFDAGVIERQHFVFAHRRCIVLNKDLRRVTGDSSTDGGLKSTTADTAFARPNYSTGPGTLTITGGSSDLFTIDDYDSSLSWKFYVRFSVGAGSGSGFIRFEFDDRAGVRSQAVTFSNAAGSPMQWETSSVTLDKNQTDIGIDVFLYSDAGAEVELSHIFIYTEPQPLAGIGV